uniref:G-protein coupled receptors family 2 profile 2 domain-containing protein n=2 Tax=Lutzomyia longipalpis TaxID=7200 RepID=A0A1B0CV46_LUTLO
MQSVWKLSCLLPLFVLFFTSCLSEVNISKNEDLIYYDYSEEEGNPRNFDTVDQEMNEAIDRDFQEHNAIDNIMYIYGSERKTVSGKNILSVGSTIALLAQTMTIILIYVRNRKLPRRNVFYPIVINFLCVSFSANFVFIVGVQASSGSAFSCEIIALVIHFLHLSVALWGLIYIQTIYVFMETDTGPNMRQTYLTAYGLPIFYITFSYILTGNGYETRHFCWLSVHRGMIVNYLIPISLLIVTTTILATITLRNLRRKQQEGFVEDFGGVVMEGLSQSTAECRRDQYDSKFELESLSLADLSIQSSLEVEDYIGFRSAVRVSLIFEPLFSICWFLGVVALENRDTWTMPIVYVVTFNILNWSLLLARNKICPIMNVSQPLVDTTLATETARKVDELIENGTVKGAMNHTPCTDTIPLLVSNHTRDCPEVIISSPSKTGKTQSSVPE